MTEKQLLRLAARIAKQYAPVEQVRRSDIIRTVVQTRKLSLADSLIMADCILKGCYQAGKTIVL